MKLKITKVDNFWYCELTGPKSVWLGQGYSPDHAFREYLQMVIDFDEEGDFDFDWCKERGLIK